jgi:NAD(P)-dependent dehydrogenase (short-subunit alcohol dehydrogenase family)
MPETREQRAVLVTGAARGGGLRTCKALAARGFRVYAGVRGEPGEVASVPGVRTVHLDVTDAQSVAGAADALRAAGERELYGLVNNAGIIVQGPLELVPEAELRRQFEVNVFGPVRVTRELLPLLRAGRGRLVNVTAPTARLPVPFMGPISGSKAALQAVSDAWRGELAYWGVGVVIVEPGAMRTDIFDTAAAAAEKALAGIPPEQVALYGEQSSALAKAAAKMKLHSPDHLADAVVRALTASRPRARYTVGPDTRLLGLLARLPLRTRDRLVMRMLGLSGASAVGTRPTP